MMKFHSSLVAINFKWETINFSKGKKLIFKNGISILPLFLLPFDMYFPFCHRSYTERRAPIFSFCQWGSPKPAIRSLIKDVNPLISLYDRNWRKQDRRLVWFFRGCAFPIKQLNNKMANSQVSFDFIILIDERKCLGSKTNDLVTGSNIFQSGNIL